MVKSDSETHGDDDLMGTGRQRRGGLSERVRSVRRVSTVDGQGWGHWKGEGGTLQAV